MKRVGKKLRPYLDKARDSALLAVEIYNKPEIAFKSAGYITLMVIAWTSLFHAIYVRNNQRPYHKGATGRYVKVDGDYKHWELKECVQKFWGNDTQNPVRKNLEFFIPLRNKIEHRHIPELDAAIFGECQALLLNFDALLGTEFGDKRRLRESLTFSLQLFPSGESFATAVKANRSFRDIKRFVDDYRSSISADIQNSGQFSFKAFLIQVANHQSQDALAIQFVQYDKLSDDQKAEVSRLPALIKLKSVGVVNADLMKAGGVVKAVQAGLGNPKIDRNGKQVAKFNQDTHIRCWRRFNVRPPGKAEKPEFTDQRYCSYDKAHGDYLYTPAWVEFLIEKMKIDAEYLALFSD